MTRAMFSAVGLTSSNGRDLVQEDVLVRLDEVAQHLTEVVEVDDPTALVELVRAEHCLDAPVVAVQAFTLARREPQLMGGGDTRLLADFPHLAAT